MEERKKKEVLHVQLQKQKAGGKTETIIKRKDTETIRLEKETETGSMRKDTEIHWWYSRRDTDTIS